MLTFFLLFGVGYSTEHISSKRDKLSSICSGKGILYMSIKIWGKAWAHKPELYTARTSFILWRTSADTLTADWGQGAEWEGAETVALKRSEASQPGWKEDATTEVLFDARPVCVGAEGWVHSLLWVVAGELSCWGTRARLRSVTGDKSFPEEATTDSGEKTKVGFTKGLPGETLGLGTGREMAGEESWPRVKCCEEMGAELVVGQVEDVGQVLVVLSKGTVEGLGGRGG